MQILEVCVSNPIAASRSLQDVFCELREKNLLAKPKAIFNAKVQRDAKKRKGREAKSTITPAQIIDRIRWFVTEKWMTEK